LKNPLYSSDFTIQDSKEISKHYYRGSELSMSSDSTA